MVTRRPGAAAGTYAWLVCVCEQGRGGGGVAAQSGALMGNHNPMADAEAAHGPNPSVQRASANGAANGAANGNAASQAPANGNGASSSSSSDEDMENGQAGPTGRGSQAPKS